MPSIEFSPSAPTLPDSLHLKGSPMPWTFSLKPDEPVLSRWHRLFDELLSDGPIHDDGPTGRLADFLNVVGREGDPVGIIAGKPTNHVEGWRTNCAMTQHAAMVHCGRSMRSDVNAEPIQGGPNTYLELAVGDARWVPNNGMNRPVGPAIAYVTAPFEHVFAFGTPIDAAAGYWISYEGGGGDGTKIGKSDRILSHGHIAGWWEILDLLPASSETTTAGDVVRDETPAEVDGNATTTGTGIADTEPPDAT